MRRVGFIVVGIFLLFLCLLHAYTSYILPRGKGVELLASMESKIAKYNQPHRKKFSLFAYPDPTFISKIKIIESEDSNRNNLLKVIFSKDKFKRFYGLNFNLALNLKPFHENGSFNFFLKTVSENKTSGKLDVYLREHSIAGRVLKSSVEFETNGEWKKVSLPINSFLLTDEFEVNSRSREMKLVLEIKEMLFSTSDIDMESTVEVLIDDIILALDEKSIYEIN